MLLTPTCRNSRRDGGKNYAVVFSSKPPTADDALGARLAQSGEARLSQNYPCCGKTGSHTSTGPPQPFRGSTLDVSAASLEPYNPHQDDWRQGRSGAVWVLYRTAKREGRIPTLSWIYRGAYIKSSWVGIGRRDHPSGKSEAVASVWFLTALVVRKATEASRCRL
jgi:hypothetical protein